MVLESVSELVVSLPYSLPLCLFLSGSLFAPRDFPLSFSSFCWIHWLTQNFSTNSRSSRGTHHLTRWIHHATKKGKSIQDCLSFTKLPPRSRDRITFRSGTAPRWTVERVWTRWIRPTGAPRKWCSERLRCSTTTMWVSIFATSWNLPISNWTLVLCSDSNYRADSNSRYEDPATHGEGPNMQYAPPQSPPPAASQATSQPYYAPPSGPPPAGK